MTDWNALSVGATEEVLDNGAKIRVHRAEDAVFIIRRYFDGAWQNTVWIREVGVGWGVSRELGVMGTPVDTLLSAIDEGVIRSREAIRQTIARHVNGS